MKRRHARDSCFCATVGKCFCTFRKFNFRIGQQELHHSTQNHNAHLFRQKAMSRAPITRLSARRRFENAVLAGNFLVTVGSCLGAPTWQRCENANSKHFGTSEFSCLRSVAFETRIGQKRNIFDAGLHFMRIAPFKDEKNFENATRFVETFCKLVCKVCLAGGTQVGRVGT